MISGVNECKCCLNLKRELKEIQEELISAKLIIKLLQTEDSANEHVGCGTTEPQNSIQSNELNAEKNHGK
jgi:thioredoxin-related protein